MNKVNLNLSDYQILNSIIDRENSKGISKLRGITTIELADITGFSLTKIRNTLSKLLDKGFVDYAVKRGKSNAFHITEKGLNEMIAVGMDVVDIDNNREKEE